MLAQKSANATSLNFGRIAKPLRGGGGAVSASSSGPPPAPSSGAGYGGSANPLARVQQEDAGPAGEKISWRRMVRD